MNTQTEKPITIDEASRILGISKSHLYKLTSAGEIPHYKPFGKRIYLYLSELNSFIKSNKIGRSQDEINSEAAKRTMGAVK